MKESGAKLPESHLVDPIAALRLMRLANYTLPLLLRKERRLRRKFQNYQRPNTNLNLQSNSDLKVY
jgi:hypothetical protein